jgi:hypothetical protein
MSTVVIPNEIRAGQSLDPRPVMANFDELALFINDDVLTLDGSKAMTGHLTLSGPGVAGGHAVTKAQLDDAVGGDVAGGGFLPLAGGTITGNLVVTGTSKVGGKDVSVDGHTHSEYSETDHEHDGVYTKKEIDDLLAARPLMKMCDKPHRVYDQRSPRKCLTWYKVQLPATVGGISRSGAKAAYLNMTSILAARNSWIAVRPDGSNWNPNEDGNNFATLNITTGEIDNEHFLTKIGSNGAIQFWVHGDSPSDDGIEGLVVDVIALVF